MAPAPAGVTSYWVPLTRTGQEGCWLSWWGAMGGWARGGGGDAGRPPACTELSHGCSLGGPACCALWS